MTYPQDLFELPQPLDDITRPSSKSVDIVSGSNPDEALRVLLIEDNLINQKVIVNLVKKTCKAELTTAKNGIEGFEKRTREGPFDLVLCDLHMPLCDGFECVKKIRHWEKTNNVSPLPICALTADSNPDTRYRCLSDGFTDFTTKPLRKETLKHKLASLCPSIENAGTQSTTMTSPSVTPKQMSTMTKQHPCHTLIVHESPVVRFLLQNFLVSKGHAVSECSSIDSGVELLETLLSKRHGQGRIGLILYHMKVPSFTQTVQDVSRFRKISESVKVVGVTKKGLSAMAVEKACAAGLASVLPAPFRLNCLDQLSGCLEELVSWPEERQKQDITANQAAREQHHALLSSDKVSPPKKSFSLSLPDKL